MKYFHWLTVASVIASIIGLLMDRQSQMDISEVIQQKLNNRIELQKEALAQGAGYIYDESAMLEDVAVLVYEDRLLINWNTYHDLPDLSAWGVDPLRFYEEDEDFYLIDSRSEGNVRIYAITTLKRSYPFDNSYLAAFSNEQVLGRRSIELGHGPFSLKLPGGDTLCYNIQTSFPSFHANYPSF